ncbi:hypothetical protein [Hamadaea tsunoensis]|uniref:hypothetical protein n=1 Tax=Hamadaea tsunoensis TaxID=53368 RepID=UPI0003FB3CBE|nr:hypothetical protein [Hamadaea tsunoensis]
MTEPHDISLYTEYLPTLDEALERVAAADLLGLGFRLESYVVADPGDDDSAPRNEYAFTLLSELPVRLDESSVPAAE